jgi:hypothetical protein
MYVWTWVGRCFVILGDHVARPCNMDALRKHTPQIIISLSVSTFLNHSKSSMCSPSRFSVGICMFFLCREAQKHRGHQPQSHNAVSLPASIMHPIVWCYVITEYVNIYFQCVWDRYGRRKSHLKTNDTILWTLRTIQPSTVKSVWLLQALRSVNGFCSSSVSDSSEGDGFYFIGITEVRCGTAGWGTALQAGRSLVRFAMWFFSNLILAATPYLWVRLSL